MQVRTYSKCKFVYSLILFSVHGSFMRFVIVATTVGLMDFRVRSVAVVVSTSHVTSVPLLIMNSVSSGEDSLHY